MKTALAFAAALLLAAPPSPAQEIKREKPGNPVLLMKTNFGDVYLELFPEEAPRTVKNFMALASGARAFTDHKTGEKAKRPFYDGLTFHRVIKGFMIQGGDPRGDGAGGPGYRFEDEINAEALGLHRMKALEKGRVHPFLGIRTQSEFRRVLLHPLLHKMGVRSQADMNAREKEVQARLNALTLKEAYENMGYRFSPALASRPPVKGSLAMANSGPDTNGSQFFINLADTPWLAGKHTVFGRVARGMEVVERIGETPVGAGAAPVKEARIISIRTHPR